MFYFANSFPRYLVFQGQSCQGNVQGTIMIIDCVFCKLKLYISKCLNVECWSFVMISPNTGHIHSSSMYDGDMEAGRWMDRPGN